MKCLGIVSLYFPQSLLNSVLMPFIIFRKFLVLISLTIALVTFLCFLFLDSNFTLDVSLIFITLSSVSSLFFYISFCYSPGALTTYLTFRSHFFLLLHLLCYYFHLLRLQTSDVKYFRSRLSSRYFFTDSNYVVTIYCLLHLLQCF